MSNTARFQYNLKYMLDNQQSTVDRYSAQGLITSDSVDWNTLSEFEEVSRLFESDICFKSSKSDITLKLEGNGVVTITQYDSTSHYTLTDEQLTITLVNETNNVHNDDIDGVDTDLNNSYIDMFFINGIENISTIDISANEISELYINKDNAISKLVIYNNNICALDVSMCKELQFLHMFNNPVCSDVDKMKAVIKQLPDRNEKPFGSIILYDWVNLGLCGYFNAADRLFYHDKEYKFPLKTYANEIYRDIASIEHPWYQYVNGKFIELTDYNNMIMLRRELEGLDKSTWTYTNKEGSIFKHWVFGSAIQYNEEAWSRCDFPFKNAHIADVWETAEKGEGAGITSPDSTHFVHPMINYSRVFGYSHIGFPATSYKTGGIAPVSKYNKASDIPSTISSYLSWIEPGCYKVEDDVIKSVNSSGKLTFKSSVHGDTCWSFMGDRGITSLHKGTFGVAPEARYYLMKCYVDSSGFFSIMPSTQNDYCRFVAKAGGISDDIITTITNETKGTTDVHSDYASVVANDINVFTRSIGSFGGISKTDPYLFMHGLYSETFEYITAFNSQGNSGDGFSWTDDQGSGSDNAAQNDNYQLGKGCSFVTSLNNNKQLSVYSSNDRSDKPFTYSYCCYGENVRVFGPSLQKVGTGSGTSYATPLHAAETALLYVIYSKIHNLYKLRDDCYTWYIVNNKATLANNSDKHLDTLIGQSRAAIGRGTVDMLCYNTDTSVHLIEQTFNATNPAPCVVYVPKKLHRITEFTDSHVVDEGQQVHCDINNIIMSNKTHTEFIPLNKGSHRLVAYSNQRNPIEDNSAVYGITDDLSENIWYSTINIDASNSTNIISTPHKADIEVSDESQIKNNVFSLNYKDGWTLNLLLQYNLNTTDGASTNLIIDKYIQLVATTTGGADSKARNRIKFSDRNSIMATSDVDGTTIAQDCWLNASTEYRSRGYLGMVEGRKSILTIVKRAHQNVFDFYINGQYIISHKSTYDYEKTEVSTDMRILNGYNSTPHFNCMLLHIHNRELTHDDLLKHVLYLHQQYIKEA